MSRKYLKEIGIKLEDTSWGWNDDDEREKMGRKKKKTRSNR